jgi:hypothetical protein
MSRWFRVYDDMVDDPKVQRLPDASFKVLVNLWCLASQCGGKLPSIDDMAFKLRMKPEKVAALISSLTNAGLIDEIDDELAPHNWDKRQFKSDVSNERVKRHRERKCNVTDTVTVTPPDTESDTDTEHIQKKDIRAVATAPRPDVYFEEFWGKYPKRDGANPKEPARKKFLAAVKSGADPEAIIRAAKRSADEARSNGQIGTPYVPQAVTWLNQQRWGDYPALTVIAGTPTPPDPSLPSDAELRARYERKEATGREQDQTSGPARVFPQGAGADGEEPAGFRDQARVG